MFSIFLVLITIVCFLLIVVIMVQNPKGGGLSSTLGSTQMGGVQKTTDFLDKSTWTLATILVILILFSGVSFNASSSDSKIIDTNNSATPAPIKPASPVVPAPAKPNSIPAK